MVAISLATTKGNNCTKRPMAASSASSSGKWLDRLSSATTTSASQKSFLSTATPSPSNNIMSSSAVAASSISSHPAQVLLLRKRRAVALISVACLLILATAWLIFVVIHHRHMLVLPSSPTLPNQPLLSPTTITKKQQSPIEVSSSSSSRMYHRDVAIDRKEQLSPSDVNKQQSPGINSRRSLPAAFDAILERARQMKEHCQGLDTAEDGAEFDLSTSVRIGNETIAALPSFGIIPALEQWTASQSENQDEDEINKWQCQLPPETECQEEQFTVIFMAYNPDRLGITLKEIQRMFNPKEYHGRVQEVILVWNGPRHVDESQGGQDLLAYAQSRPIRVVYPLKMGLPNDLMNRYHPDVVQVKTKALLYYDDDGPFYSYAAVESGFELWKRHASAQIGAMARELTYSPRQLLERQGISPEPTDQHFVSHCSNVDDKVDYNFRYFANYDANMVLPSGSFLHANYLCFLWHPALEPIRKFVLDHPVHPDDMTVSLVVSQLSGRAPRVYSRRLNPDHSAAHPLPAAAAKRLHHRRLMKGICWDCGAGMTDMKQHWADLRTEAINALIRYFGSLNSGSIGWCEGTRYYRSKTEGKCHPVMAKQGWLPWMQSNGAPKDTCP